MLDGFAQATSDDEPSVDQWGEWISGYAPIRTSDGKHAGLVGIDLPVAEVHRIQNEFMFHAVVLLGSTLLAFVAAGWLVARYLRRPIDALRKGMMAVAGGDLHASVEIPGERRICYPRSRL